MNLLSAHDELTFFSFLLNAIWAVYCTKSQFQVPDFKGDKFGFALRMDLLFPLLLLTGSEENKNKTEDEEILKKNESKERVWFLFKLHSNQNPD